MTPTQLVVLIVGIVALAVAVALAGDAWKRLDVSQRRFLIAFGLALIILADRGFARLEVIRHGGIETAPWFWPWVFLLAALGLLFVVWSWVPLERLDAYWSENNEIGRPLAHTLVLTGLPALYARVVQLPRPWVLIPICFFLTQYAALSGRFLRREFNIAGWVLLIAAAAVWIAFYRVGV